MGGRMPSRGAVFVFLSLVALSLATPARAVVDTTPPTISGLQISPTSVDVTNGSATVIATATLRDDISGIRPGGQIRFLSPSRRDDVQGSWTHVSGDQYRAV